MSPRPIPIPFAAAGGRGGGRGRGRIPIRGPENETPQERFIRIAEPRVAKLIAGIRAMGAMNRKEYGPPKAELIEQMIAELHRAVDELAKAYERPAGTGGAGFRFRDGMDGDGH